MRGFLCQVNTLISERGIHNYFKRNQSKKCHQTEDTSTIFPWVWRVCHCEPGKTRNYCQKHWALAQVKGSCTLWHVQSLRLAWRKNSKPKQAGFTLMDIVVSWYWEAEGQNSTSRVMLGAREAHRYKEAVGGHKNTSHVQHHQQVLSPRTKAPPL